MKRLFSIFMGLVIAALCLFSINEKEASLPVPEAEAVHEDNILHQVRTVMEWRN